MILNIVFVVIINFFFINKIYFCKYYFINKVVSYLRNVYNNYFIIKDSWWKVFNVLFYYVR